MAIVFGWIIFSIVAGVIANAKGRSGFGYFFLSLILSPLIGLIAAAAMPAISKSTANPVAGTAPGPESHIKCPECCELVLREARKCKHCGAALTPVVETPVAEMTEEQLIEHYGIRPVNGRWELSGHSYASIQEALKYAPPRS